MISENTRRFKKCKFHQPSAGYAIRLLKPKMQVSKFYETKDQHGSYVAALISVTVRSNRDITTEVTSALKISMALLQYFLPFFAVSLFFQIELNLVKLPARGSKSIAVNR